MKDHSAVSEPRKTDASDSERKTKVLLVDDEDRFRRDLADRLTLRGLEVEDAAEGEEAVRIARIHRPDVVILDRKMPGMQGEEVLVQIKRVAPEVQVVMLTGHASIESAEETGRLDAFAYLQKPCETEVLMETIKSARREKMHAMARHEMVQVESQDGLGMALGRPQLPSRRADAVGGALRGALLRPGAGRHAASALEPKDREI